MPDNLIGKLPEANRPAQIATRRNAILRKMGSWNTKNKGSAQVKANKTKKPVNYHQQALKGKAEGYTESDFGAGKGAAIPYAIKNTPSVAKPANKTAPLTAKPMNAAIDRKLQTIKK